MDSRDRIVEFLNLDEEQKHHLSGLIVNLQAAKQMANARRPHRLNGMFRRFNLYPENFRRRLQPVRAWYDQRNDEQSAPEYEFKYSLLISGDGSPTTASLLAETKRFVRFTLYMMIDEERKARTLPPMFESKLFFRHPEAVQRFDSLTSSV